MTESPRLLPCPFCGGDELSHGRSWPPEQGSVQCRVRQVSAPDGEAVKVKPLEWRDRHTKPLRMHDIVADSICGLYQIRPSAGGASFRLWAPSVNYDDAESFVSAETAQAAAQADYETRIRSALTPSPAGEGMGPTHRHLKSGHLVRVVGRGRMQMSTIPADDMDDVVIYEHDGNLWVRAHWEFDDGRFAALPSAPQGAKP